MFYFKIRKYECECDSTKIFSSEREIEKNGVVVVSDGYGEPTTATIREKVEEYVALSNSYDVEPIISVVDMNAFNCRMNKLNKRAMVLKKMQEKMSEVKLIENLKKCAEKDADMRALFNEYTKTLLEPAEGEG